jgi:hypothetical protein
MNDFATAERLLINLPIGSVVKIPAAVGFHASFWQHQVSGIVSISPAAFCRALGL